MSIDFLAYSTLVGSLLPGIISLFKMTHWNKTAKKILAVIISLIAAVITTGANQGWTQLTWTNLFVAAAIIIGTTQVTYNSFWSDTKTEASLAALGSPKA